MVELLVYASSIVIMQIGKAVTTCTLHDVTAFCCITRYRSPFQNRNVRYFHGEYLATYLVVLPHFPRA